METLVNFALGAMFGFIVLVLLNLIMLVVRAKWFNTPSVTHQKKISDSLWWCIFWSKWALASMISFVILYVIMVK